MRDVVEETLTYWPTVEEGDIVTTTLTYWETKIEEVEGTDTYASIPSYELKDITLNLEDEEFPVLRALGRWCGSDAFNANYTYSEELLILDTLSRVNSIPLQTYRDFVRKVCRKTMALKEYLEEDDILVLRDTYERAPEISKEYIKRRAKLRSTLNKYFFEAGLLEKDEDNVFITKKGREVVEAAMDLVRNQSGVPPDSVYSYYIVHYLRLLFNSTKDTSLRRRIALMIVDIKPKNLQW